MYKPNVQQFSTPIRIQHRIETDVNGMSATSYVDANPALDFCNWKSKGGTESIQAGVLTAIDTAELTMWFRPDISEQDRVIPEGILNVWQIQMNIYLTAYEDAVGQYGEDSEQAKEAQSKIDAYQVAKPVYKVIGPPENIEMRNQFMLLKVTRVANV